MKKIFGERLLELRHECGMSQKELAKRLHIHQVTYMRYEKNYLEPSLEMLTDIAVFFGVSADWLLGIENER